MNSSARYVDLMRIRFGCLVKIIILMQTIVSKLRGMADSTAGIAKTEAALSVYDFESNTITHGSNFTTFPGKLHLSGITHID